ncbi:unnamed protein product [Caenorhabditis nigoni]
MSRHILLLLLFSVAVQAFFRPIYSGGGGEQDCEKTSTSSPSGSTPSASTPSKVTPKYSYTCPKDWNLTTRTPSQFNGQTGFLCTKFITAPASISVNSASELCKKENAALTAFENDEERLKLHDEARKHIITDLKLVAGGVAIAGDRLPQCVTQNSTVLEENMKTPPCNDSKQEYTLPESAHTNPEFLWNSWAPLEPSHTFAGRVSEDCLQMIISSNNRNGKINDIYCTVENFLNFGAYCGKPVDIVATI